MKQSEEINEVSLVIALLENDLEKNVSHGAVRRDPVQSQRPLELKRQS